MTCGGMIRDSSILLFIIRGFESKENVEVLIEAHNSQVYNDMRFEFFD